MDHNEVKKFIEENKGQWWLDAFWDACACGESENASNYANKKVQSKIDSLLINQRSKYA